VTLSSGGSLVTLGSDTYHVFTTSGSLVVPQVTTMELLVVAGGGGGGGSTGTGISGGGGGAGGMVLSTLTLQPGTYTMAVGSGGTGYLYNNASSISNGANSYVYMNGNLIVAIGGGQGGAYSDGQAGGSGGGGGYLGAGGSSTQNTLGNNGGGVGYGNAGRAGSGASYGSYPNGGGGGAGAAGGSGTGGAGRLASRFTYWGTDINGNTAPSSGKGYFAGGGAGGSIYNSSIAPVGGVGGGGRGGAVGVVCLPGNVNTGGGGGGQQQANNSAGASGGSGIIIARYVNPNSGNLLSVLADASITGSLYVGNIYSNGNLVTINNYSNTNVAQYLPVNTANISAPAVTTANLTVSNLLTTKGIIETGNVSNLPSSVANIYVLQSDVVYYTGSLANNFTVNITGDSNTKLNSIMNTGSSVSATLLVTNTSGAFYPNVYQIDGTTVTAKWLGGTAPTGGNTGSVDIYTFAIIKTASNTFSLFMSQGKYQ
jgi:hypothetical protein